MAFTGQTKPVRHAARGFFFAPSVEQPAAGAAGAGNPLRMLAQALQQLGVLRGIAANEPYLVRAQERIVLHQIGDIACAPGVDEDGLAPGGSNGFGEHLQLGLDMAFDLCHPQRQR